MAIKVLIVDDHTLFRAGLKALLSFQEDIRVIGEAGNGEEALKLIRCLNPDVVLLDIAMPGLDGLAVTRQIKDYNEGIKVLILTQHENREYLLPALKMGASGYVLKRAAADELVAAIRSLYAGKAFLDPAITETVLADYRYGGMMEETDELDTLTEREREILILLAQGRTNREIAGLLHISSKTVDFHRTNLMRKLNLHNRIELTKYAWRRGLVKP
ncbi:response regulator [Neomoorella humiferrea]|uniref:Stage 0 sporulation protein A homolog n=1 Tax=Neomoorella humiferrea TaxID=676965 RepID=A0A2T0AV43_9FIRM|nr:response regulator transcription factor [Moorella humiferrea]PRR74427.1 Oxygen regulatory protein NreC [Moorella humiferrea]